MSCFVYHVDEVNRGVILNVAPHKHIKRTNGPELLGEKQNTSYDPS